MSNLDLFAHVIRSAQVFGIIGGEGGDESKGLWTARFMKQFDAVARFGGGANAGHSYEDFSLHLIPMGAVKGILSYIGQGCLVKTLGAIQELAAIQTRFGITPRLRIDRNCPVWTPYHEYLETYVERLKGAQATDSTRQSIGPMAAVDLLRTSARAGMLLEPSLLRHGILELHDIFMPIFKEMQMLGMIKEIAHPHEVWTKLYDESAPLRPFITDVGFELREKLRRGERIIAEGHQATILDPKFGTWPYVTATPCTAHGISYGLGIAPNACQDVLLITKTMPTRVGAGPFPSEIWDRTSAKNFPKEHPELFEKNHPRRKPFLTELREKINAETASDPEIAQYFQVLAYELGGTTGRGRSVGYFDRPWHRYSITVNGAKWVALSLLDVLSGIKRIKYVSEYWMNSKRLQDGQMPASWEMTHPLETTADYWECWPEDISGCSSWEGLAKGAKRYVERVQDTLGVPILVTSTGPEENSWMMVNGG